MRGFSVINPNAPAPAPAKNWKRPPMQTDRAMAAALERARAAQPPLSAMRGGKSKDTLKEIE
ncbi:hypothetical protein [Pigmentiphaga daeguensis]|uniref:Uncharacterized protein n=1 Tax=Pigmentiphaga daeguensis TaxID=414049 RepID=A0ABN1BAH7_9BURK